MFALSMLPFIPAVCCTGPRRPYPEPPDQKKPAFPLGINGNTIFPVAVAVGRYIADQGNMETGPVFADGISIFRDLAVQNIIALIQSGADRVFGTYADTSAASHAFFFINKGFAFCNGNSLQGRRLLYSSRILRIWKYAQKVCPHYAFPFFPPGIRLPYRYFSRFRRILLPHGL